ncbi:MAG: epoxyqueuosine reductase QueH [Desulfomonilaceae bacterium]|nr:epoxyqueuosine reductase QueH [Desulfomonilaceae bacterium]
MRILLHSCCAPCLVVPLDDLRREGNEVTALFFNPNIHPYTEYLRRLDAFNVYTRDNDVQVLNEKEQEGLEEWLRQVVFRESQRCGVCFNFRIDKTARLAEAKGFDAFSTTLLYSRFQKHDLLKSICEATSEKYGIPFIYRDWRTGWNEGVKRYRKLGLYRQKYCGCIYSEKERAVKIL